MSWYKKAQQSLMFYPYRGKPEAQNERIRPSSVDPETGQNVYPCSNCEKMVIEENIEKWVVREDKDDHEEVSYNMPPYAYEDILQTLTSISQYLLPFYNKLQQYIQEAKLESKRNETYDYGFDSALRRWEVQIPQLPEIFKNSPALTDICSYQHSDWNRDTLCNLSNKREISGYDLNSISDIILNPNQKAKEFAEYSNKQFEISYSSYPVCWECAAEMTKCVFCEKKIFPGSRKYETTWDDESFVCEKCIEDGVADTCMQCGKAEAIEDLTYRGDDGMWCSDCYKGIATEAGAWAEEQISNLAIPVGKNIPLSSKVLDNLWEFLTRYVAKYGNNELTSKELGRLYHVSKKSGLPNGAIEYLNYIGNEYNLGDNDFSSYTVDDILKNVNNNTEAQDYMKEQYPNLKSYQDLPFDIEVLSNYNDSKPGFTLAITPSDDFFDYAENKYPNIRKVWDGMSNTPHHSGTLAYARCAYDMGDNLVINNLQRDADIDNYESVYNREKSPENLEIARWIDITTKNWDSFLLNLIKAMCISKNISAYLTTFNQQKNRWSNLPIHKSKKTYKETPERMGFELSDPPGIDNLMETGWENMYQVANIGRSWYKKANI